MKNKEQKEDERKLYYLVLSFYSPVVGNHTILAEDEDHARRLAQEMFSDTLNFKVIDCYDLEDSPGIRKLIETPAKGGLH